MLISYQWPSHDPRFTSIKNDSRNRKNGVATSTKIQKMSPTSEFCHQHHCHRKNLLKEFNYQDGKWKKSMRDGNEKNVEENEWANDSIWLGFSRNSGQNKWNFSFKIFSRENPKYGLVIGARKQTFRFHMIIWSWNYCAFKILHVGLHHVRIVPKKI